MNRSRAWPAGAGEGRYGQRAYPLTRTPCLQGEGKTANKVKHP